MLKRTRDIVIEANVKCFPIHFVQYFRKKKGKFKKRDKYLLRFEPRISLRQRVRLSLLFSDSVTTHLHTHS